VILEWNGDEFLRDVDLSIDGALDAVGYVVRDEMAKLLDKKSSHKSTGGTPSQPGEPPAKDTATLSRSLTHKVNDDRSVGVGVASGSPANEYALTMEYGSRGAIKPKTAKALSWKDKKTGERVFAKQVFIKPRPFLRPALKKSATKANETFAFQLRRQLSEWLD